MKHLGLVPIILLMGMWIIGGATEGQLTASQQVPSPATVGETVMVTVMLTYNGDNSTEAVVTPSLPSGVVSDMPGSQTTELYPGSLSPVSYPIRAEQSGTYWIVSQIAYAESGTWRRLRLEAPFTATGESASNPGGSQYGNPPQGGSSPWNPVPGTSSPGGMSPSGDENPGSTAPGETSPGGMAPGAGNSGETIPESPNPAQMPPRGNETPNEMPRNPDGETGLPGQ